MKHSAFQSSKTRTKKDSARIIYLLNIVKSQKNKSQKNKSAKKSNLNLKMTDEPTLDIETINNDTPNKYSKNELPIKNTLITKTLEDQLETETLCLHLYHEANRSSTSIFLDKEKHNMFLIQPFMRPLPGGFVALDASKPWMVYWVANSMGLLGFDYTLFHQGMVDTIFETLGPSGGFGGGFQQVDHAASNYAAILSLALSGDEKAWSKIDRRKIYKWFMELKQPDGSFEMHFGGEKDVRATYCILTVAVLLNIITDELIKDTAKWIASCQTYEGGFGGEPDTEAHGGYCFCALAALSILGNPQKILQEQIDLDSFVRWLSHRQYYLEGGFSGRTNKLVDGCYSHWIGGCWPLVECALNTYGLWDRKALQDYILVCAQGEYGGLRDKPGKNADFYHSCYVLNGLSTSQHYYKFDEEKFEKDEHLSAFCWYSEEINDLDIKDVNRVGAINPIFGLPEGVGEKMHSYFKNLDSK